MITSANTLEIEDAAFAIPLVELNAFLNTPPVEFTVLIENCLGEPRVAISLLERFGQTAAFRLEWFDAELQDGNLDAIGEMARSLTDVANILGASTLRKVTCRIDAVCRRKNIRGAEQLIRSLRSEIQRILQMIPSLCARLEQWPTPDKGLR